MRDPDTVPALVLVFMTAAGLCFLVWGLAADYWKAVVTGLFMLLPLIAIFNNLHKAS